MTEDAIRREIWAASWMTTGHAPNEMQYQWWLEHWAELLARGEEIHYRSPIPENGTGGLAYARDRLLGWQTGGSDIPPYGRWATPPSAFFSPVPPYPSQAAPAPTSDPTQAPSPEPGLTIADVLVRLDHLETLIRMLAADPDPRYHGSIGLPRWLGGDVAIDLEPVQPKR